MAAVAVLFDRSLSMPLNGLFWAAQERATAAIEALDGSDTGDELVAVVEFARHAQVVDKAHVSSIEWDYGYGSNLADAIELGVSSLSGQPGEIRLYSDLFASAHTDTEGNVIFQCPPSRETLDRTVEAIYAGAQAAVTIAAFRFCSGEPEPGEEWPIRAVTDAILAIGGTVAPTYIENVIQGRQTSWRYSAQTGAASYPTYRGAPMTLLSITRSATAIGSTSCM